MSAHLRDLGPIVRRNASAEVKQLATGFPDAALAHRENTDPRASETVPLDSMELTAKKCASVKTVVDAIPETVNAFVQRDSTERNANFLVHQADLELGVVKNATAGILRMD